VEVVVVDNDSDRSAQETVRAAQGVGNLEINYDCEPEQNIALSRNRAIRNASGNLIAFIDDDEWPMRDWLVRLYGTLTVSVADGVLGPVLPDFPEGAPDWLKKGQLFNRRRHATGTPISAEDARTGNMLVRRSVFVEGDVWFDYAFGRTGGEDSDFFWRQFRSGRVFVWCDEAGVYETVSTERWTMLYHVKRFLRSGTLDGERLRAGRLESNGLVARSVLLFWVTAALTPVSLFLPRHFTTRVLQKLAYCSGIIAAYCGVSLLRFRD
jgi:glycosyltransferase involved in cell wall biosynthesis